jgi:hypothetical protein
VTNYGREVALCCPSVDVIAPHGRSVTAYGRWHGTSLAAPFTTGAAAVLLESYAGTPAQEIGRIILRTLSPHGPLPASHQGLMGGGLLNLEAALRR